MKKILLLWAVSLSLAVSARLVDVETYVANPGNMVSVGISVDELSDAGAASLVINYDPTIVACLGVDAGGATDESKMTYADTGAGQIVVVIPAFKAESGVVARIRLFVRKGTAGQFSDVTVAAADFAAKDAVTDLSVSNPLKIRNGMVRSMALDAAVARLEEPFAVCPKTAVKELALSDGDSLMASDDGLGVTVAGAVKASGAIPVKAPLCGWQTGRYEIMSTPTPNLAFRIVGADEARVFSQSSGGVVVYYADVKVEGAIEIVGEGGDIEKGLQASIRDSLAGELASSPGVAKVIVKGDLAIIPVAVDLGIKPSLAVEGTQAVAEYSEPALRITAFDPKTGLVRIKVTPGKGNAIKSQIATGCIHVYGTDDLHKKMRYISGVSIDASPYLDEKTKGEANLTVALGANAFLKVKAEKEIKKEGDTE